MKERRLTTGVVMVSGEVSSISEREFHDLHKLDGLIVGSRVHYVFEKGGCRPAEVVRVWNGVVGTVNLVVGVDGTNDVPGERVTTTVWRTSVTYSERHVPGSWHWLPADLPFAHVNPYEDSCT